MENLVAKDFWLGKKVLVTGHTGFKGSWLSLILSELGSELYGISLKEKKKLNLFYETKLSENIKSYYGDINDYQFLKKNIEVIQPDIIFHLAAQSLVLESYEEPLKTFNTNIIGTANLIDLFVKLKKTKVFINVTSDKVYKNTNDKKKFKEDDELGGEDPYSASKACAEIVSSSLEKSFLKDQDKALCNVRAGNVIGGGDWANNRLIPDIIRSFESNTELSIRNMNSTRPWQFVLDPLIGYIVLAQKSFINPNNFKGSWNFGPSDKKIYNVESIINFSIKNFFNNLIIKNLTEESKPEAIFLDVDSSKVKKYTGWFNLTKTDEALRLTFEWYKSFLQGEDIYKLSVLQINKILNKYGTS